MIYVFLTIIAYILFNFSIIEAGNSLLNIAIANVIGGLFTMWWRKGRPWKGNLLHAIPGAIGIPLIVYGLSFSHKSLQAPGEVMEVVYDIFIVSFTITLWAFNKTKMAKVDMPRHLVMLALVGLRLVIHWKSHWTFMSFVPVLVAVLGYILFNTSIKISQNNPSTNSLMNILGGVVLALSGLFVPGVTVELTSISWVAAFSGGSILLLVWAFGSSYGSKFFAKCVEVVPAMVYDGLLLAAPLTIGLWYGQNFYFVDFLITLGFLAVAVDRLWCHKYGLPFYLDALVGFAGARRF
ncbi:hypothetical protein KKH43_06515 [Patescibacteria group bacterium]|nr:hypothetical protein [Patescibacteria group bacterium]